MTSSTSKWKIRLIRRDDEEEDDDDEWGWEPLLTTTLAIL